MNFNNEFQQLEKLAGLKLSPQEELILEKDIGEVLSYVEQLGKYDLSDVKPLTHIHQVSNVIRNDEIATPLFVDEVLANCKEKEGNFFKVPNIMNKS